MISSETGQTNELIGRTLPFAVARLTMAAQEQDPLAPHPVEIVEPGVAGILRIEL
jgi:hypothetical protein